MNYLFISYSNPLIVFLFQKFEKKSFDFRASVVLDTLTIATILNDFDRCEWIKKKSLEQLFRSSNNLRRVSSFLLSFLLLLYRFKKFKRPFRMTAVTLLLNIQRHSTYSSDTYFICFFFYFVHSAQHKNFFGLLFFSCIYIYIIMYI